MGIKHLNKFLMTHCNRNGRKSILPATSFAEFRNKTLVIDASIYIYKYLEEKALIENMYLFISILLHHEITPVFIFDGKSPPEKKDTLDERRQKKMDAERAYTELQAANPNTQHLSPEELSTQLDLLRRQFVRMTNANVRATKELLNAYGVPYFEATGEADIMCVRLVLSGHAWACISDDMDMFVYGCPRVIRNVSLMGQKCCLYILENILADLQMDMKQFRQIMVLSGTDYKPLQENNLMPLSHTNNGDAGLYETMNWFREYNRQMQRNACIDKGPDDFYEWLCKYTKYITNREHLMRIYQLFVLGPNNDCDDCNPLPSPETMQLKPVNVDELHDILAKEGFLK